MDLLEVLKGAESIEDLFRTVAKALLEEIMGRSARCFSRNREGGKTGTTPGI